MRCSKVNMCNLEFLTLSKVSKVEDLIVYIIIDVNDFERKLYLSIYILRIQSIFQYTVSNNIQFEEIMLVEYLKDRVSNWTLKTNQSIGCFQVVLNLPFLLNRTASNLNNNKNYLWLSKSKQCVSCTH